MKAGVRELYKQLLFLGRDYPAGYPYFRERLKKAFQKNSTLADPKSVEQAVQRGQFVIKELEAMYKLNKYRALKKRYYDEPERELLEFEKKLHSPNL
ncbi:LYR motif-containing protein 5 [Basidiobolus meristosporus CBS 931.73]|uniref:LYR motif-containing protein 5 n=1 Tax=Basidiobolus meristosporus CBS 931.73 TaxID=1314790 RepID=A0A1Y1Z9V1_9FUNG|nr:LYR motif-containing protein 5 [Basidiobolus meristosporus CBS 931.73]|eukprot:ORY06807.1 LYR motif-containing protein 5 [Basidiobolus meristosporus CBS 931.73]